MSIISKMDRRTVWGRFVIGLIFLFLTVGGLTILYPFAIMVSGSLRSEMDETDLNFIPEFMVKVDPLYRKFLEYKYNQDVESLNRAHRGRYFQLRTISAPLGDISALAAHFKAFEEEIEIPAFWYRLGGLRGIRTIPANARTYRERVAAHFDHDQEAFRQATGSVDDSWLSVAMPPPEWLSRQYVYAPGPLFDVYEEMLEAAPVAERDYMTLDGHFLRSIIYPRYGRVSTAAFNEAHPEIALESYDDFVMSAISPPPEMGLLRSEWLEYVRAEVNPSFVEIDARQQQAFLNFLVDRYGEITEANRVWGTSYDAFESVPLPDGRHWLSAGFRTDCEAFLQDLPAEDLRLHGPDMAWRDWLRTRYATVEEANAALGLDAVTLDAIRIPVDAVEYEHVLANTGALRRQFALNNYVNVLDALFTHGRTFINTAIYCLLVVGLNLLINPMAAYGLSRFRLKGTYKVLLILMATAAFPPMVTLIPQFVILQNLNLMNTFIALLLPTLANGYLIFLLKGFFDSLPQDLYDAALIDGASELRVFFQITMALSKPILAVVALNSFTMAYTAFLYPLLVAPDPDMWLISVWLYQFQEQSSMSGVFASVLVASVPTIIIFLFAQNIILRGIAVPMEK